MREKTNRQTEMIFLIVVNGSSPMVEIELDAAEKGLKAGRGCQKWSTEKSENRRGGERRMNERSKRAKLAIQSTSNQK